MSKTKEKRRENEKTKDIKDIYHNHPVQLLMSRFLSGKLTTLKPIFDSKRGYHFPLIETIISGDSSKDANTRAVLLLDNLHELGLLKRHLYDRIIYCPSCSSTSISIHYCCPYCKSFNVKKSALVEHIQCGYIDIEDKFVIKNKHLCPACGKQLHKVDVDYRKAGVWCSCNDCNKSFDIPVISHFCRNCYSTFTFEECAYKDVYEYSISEKAVDEFGLGLIFTAPIKDFLEKNGLKVENPGFLIGKSGANHMFDIVAHDEKGGVVVIDLSTSVNNVVSEQPIISMFAKVYDASPNKAFFIAIPKANENGRKMAALYKIKLVEAIDQGAAIQALREMLAES